MKMLIRYMILLLSGGIIIPICCHLYARKPISAKAGLRTAHAGIKPATMCRDDQGMPLPFYSDMIQKIFPVLKNLN